MEEKKTVLGYGAQILSIFGFTMICLMVFAYIFGESAKEFSSLFSLGNEGLTVSAMAEFLLLSAIIVLLQDFYCTDRFFKRMPILARVVVLVLTVLAVIVAFIFLFDWFPINMWLPWVMFLACYTLCVGGSITVSAIMTRQENRKLGKGLDSLKEQWEEKDGK